MEGKGVQVTREALLDMALVFGISLALASEHELEIMSDELEQTLLDHHLAIVTTDD